LVGERAALQPGLLTAVSQLAADTGATIGWVPRRAGERGAVEAGLLPSLLPGGRPVADAAGRVDAAAVWGVPGLSETSGLDLPQMLSSAVAGDLTALVFAGADPADLPGNALAAAQRAAFVLALDTRNHEIVERADVVLPVAAAPEKSGAFVNWEGRLRPFDQAIRPSSLMSDARVLRALARELDVDLGLGDVAAARAQLDEFSGWQGARVKLQGEASASASAPQRRAAGKGDFVLSTWRPLLDHGSLQQGEPYLAATARGAQIQLSASDAASIGCATGEHLTVSSEHASVVAEVAITDVHDGAVVVTGGGAAALGNSGELVTLAKGGAA
ncbi:MAG TPA: molybdopterin-dependent oxidoreductase, partial [Actinomycetes bacterium]|nr:molybdopterin-dependent oxidoreductase [Actinomycetes bacterium]